MIPERSSIDFAAARLARRRLIREGVTIVLSSVVLIALVATFYRILAS